MRWLCDENLHNAIGRWLQAKGHDVTFGNQTSVGEDDAAVLQLCIREDRLLMTDDKDFGELVIRQHVPAPGVVLIRLDRQRIAQRLETLQWAWSNIETNVRNSLIVVEPGVLRIRSLR